MKQKNIAQNNSLLYGIIGVLFGALLVWVLTTTAVNSNQLGMMQIMGIRKQTNFNVVGMMNSSIDRHFIEQMIPHHKDAISMAEIALQKAEHPVIKQLAQNVKTSQSREISQMKSWYRDWYGSNVPEGSDNDRNSGHMTGRIQEGMMGDETYTKSLENASNFDKAFMEEMIPHHKMAVMMANMLLSETARPEMKQLAKNIIASQTKEINEMRQWYTAWNYKYE